MGKRSGAGMLLIEAAQVQIGSREPWCERDGVLESGFRAVEVLLLRVDDAEEIVQPRVPRGRLQRVRHLLSGRSEFAGLNGLLDADKHGFLNWSSRNNPAKKNNGNRFPTAHANRSCRHYNVPNLLDSMLRRS